MEVKDNSKRAESQIKSLAISKAALVNYYREESVRIPYKKRARTGVLPSRKQQG